MVEKFEPAIKKFKCNIFDRVGLGINDKEL